MFCMRCGNAVPDDASFCPVCGEKLMEQNESTVNTQTQGVYDNAPQSTGKNAPARKKKTWLAILLSSIGGVLILVLIGVIIYPNIIRMQILNDMNLSDLDET